MRSLRKKILDSILVISYCQRKRIIYLQIHA